MIMPLNCQKVDETSEPTKLEPFMKKIFPFKVQFHNYYSQQDTPNLLFNEI